MSRIRDIANLFSANTDAATDAEVASAISSHNTTANGHVKRGNTDSRPAAPSNGDVYANTETGYFEHYDGTSWLAVGAPASTPSSVVATNQGSGRAYNSGQASVAFSAGTITGSTYTVTSSPGSYTSSGASSPLVVTGLQSSTQYTYTVIAANKFGTSSASSASSGVTATTVPQAPTIDSVTAGSEEVSVAFTAGATGGSAITGYTVTSSPGSFTASGASSPLVVTGLTNGTAYTFTVVATNANGTSAASSASSSVTPAVPGSYESIATVTVGSGGSPNVSFSSISSDYTHLQLRLIARSNLSSQGQELAVTFNGVTSGYGRHFLRGDGTSATVDARGYTDSAYFLPMVTGANAGSNTFGTIVLDILDYKNTNKFKTIRSLAGYDNNGSGDIFFNSTYFNWTNAISSITIEPQGGYNFVQYTQFALYGIKGA
jgi:hypothetical protein